MSSPALVMLEKLRKRFEKATPDLLAAFTGTDIVQYNIRSGGDVLKSITVNMKDHLFIDGPATNDLEITIDDEDMQKILHSTAFFKDLLSQEKIEVKGDRELLKILDDRIKKYGESVAAAKLAAKT